MTDAQLVTLAVFLPALATVPISLAASRPNLREAISLATAATTAVVVLSLVPGVIAGARPETARFSIFAGIELGFAVEPLGMLFASVASVLWVVNTIYSIGYMRGNGEPRQTSFYVCFAVAISSAIGIAFSANLFTLFLFYEILTLSTYPLVAHRGDEEARSGGRVYILLLLGTSMVLLLPAIIATSVLAGTLDFTQGGILAGTASPVIIALLLAAYMFGIGKAALMPLHFWLPAAMVAPTPVSALLHAVAVVKAGVFTVVKVIVYVFGLDTLTGIGANEWLIYVASASLLLSSLIALTRDNLKARLAYSTVSQLAYVTLGAAVATTTSVVGSSLHIAMHAAGKITLFFCAGAIYVAHHKTEVSQLDGIGRKMPVTMAAFLVGSLSIIGMPPFGGMWSKWLLGLGALDAGQAFVVAVLMLSSLLSVGYLLPIVARGFFRPPPGETMEEVKVKEAPTACLIALMITATLCVVLFFLAGDMQLLLEGMFAPPAQF
jgi:multicomponent Na+:H+ antiporter subunit D